MTSQLQLTQLNGLIGNSSFSLDSGHWQQ